MTRAQAEAGVNFKHLIADAFGSLPRRWTIDRGCNAFLLCFRIGAGPGGATSRPPLR